MCLFKQRIGEHGGQVVWRFKALQNIVILCPDLRIFPLFLGFWSRGMRLPGARIGRFEDMATRYRELLSYMDQASFFFFFSLGSTGSVAA